MLKICFGRKLILSYLILSYLILSYLILSYLILSYLILSYFIANEAADPRGQITEPYVSTEEKSHLSVRTFFDHIWV